MSVTKDQVALEKAEAKGRKEAEKEFNAALKKLNGENKEKIKAITAAVKETAAQAKAEIEDKSTNKQVAEIFKQLLVRLKEI